jgi:uncharacterized SAM-binding protein YcdF (DUF218 family)
MFIVLAKVLDFFLAPLTWALLLFAASIALRRRMMLARGLGIAGLAVLYVFSVAPVADALVRAAERSAVRTWHPDVEYDAVIVLGGGLDAPATEASGEVQFQDAPERILRGFELLRDGRARQLLISGGSIEKRPGAPVEAEVLARMLERWGVPPEKIVVEGRSRNTRENAEYSAEVVKAHGWSRLLLVTSAAHMPRALGCFRAVGLTPDALPVDFQAPPHHAYVAGWLPRAHALDRSTETLRELAGRVIYRLLGYAR